MLNPPITIPNQKQWVQPNNGFIFGNLYGSRNINLTIPGIMSLSKRMIATASEDSASGNIGQLFSVVYGNFGAAGGYKYYFITSYKVVIGSIDLTSITADVTAGTPTNLGNFSDGVAFYDGLYVTTQTNLYKLVAGVWTGGLATATVSGLSSATPHPMCVTSIQDFLVIGDGNRLVQRTTGGVNSVALTIPSQYQIVWIRSSNLRTFIGTRNLNDGNARVFEWDEAAAAATNSYEVDCSWTLSGEFRNTDFFIVTNDGRLLRFNGGGFEKVAEFPIYEALKGNWLNGSVYATCVQRGMAVLNGKLHINISGQVIFIDSTPQTLAYNNFPSGVWVYQDEVGLYHRFGLSAHSSYDAAACDFLQQTGPAVGYTGLIASALGAVVTDPQTFGGINDSTASLLFAGGLVALPDGSGNNYVNTINSVITGINRGFFTTTRIESQQIADSSFKLWVKFRGVYTSDESIRFKYKNQLDANKPFNVQVITWTGSDSFTVDDTVTGNASFAYAEVGDEMTIMDGSGAGAVVHLTSINHTGNTYYVSINESIPDITLGDISDYPAFDNWTLLDTTITSQDTDGWKEIPVVPSSPSTWIQFKGELRGNNATDTIYPVTIEDLYYVSGQHILTQS